MNSAAAEKLSKFTVGGRLVARPRDNDILDPLEPENQLPMYIRNRRTGVVQRVPRYLGTERLKDMRTDGTGFAFEEVGENEWVQSEGLVQPEETVEPEAKPEVGKSLDRLDEISEKLDQLTEAILLLANKEKQ